MKGRGAPQLKAAAQKRTKDLQEKLIGAMKSIEIEIERSNGIYPFNKGRLTTAEVCRRAHINPAVLQGPVHKESTLLQVKTWILQASNKLISGSVNIRREVTSRADDWKQRFIDAHHHSNLYHLQMISLNKQLDSANVRIRELEAENAKLQRVVSSGVVKSIKREKR